MGKRVGLVALTSPRADVNNQTPRPARVDGLGAENPLPIHDAPVSGRAVGSVVELNDRAMSSSQSASIPYP